MARLEAISQSRASQISRWLEERVRAPGFLAASRGMADLHRQWLDDPDAGGLDRMIERVVDIRKATGYHSAFVVDAAGKIIGGEAAAGRDTAPELRTAALAAMASGRPQRTELYGYPGPPPFAAHRRRRSAQSQRACCAGGGGVPGSIPRSSCSPL